MAVTASKPLNVARRQHRLFMAGELMRLVSRDWQITYEEIEGTRELWVELKGPRGLQLTIDLDGDSKQCREGTHVLAWVIRGTDARMAPGVMVGCNPHHFAKLTEVAYSFDSLLALVAKRMASATDGSAFQ